MTEAIVDVGGRGAPLHIRINGRGATFKLGSERISAQALAPIDPVLEDLLEIACTVFAADSAVGRGGKVRSHMGTSWRRRFHFCIPVRDPGRWSDPGVTSALVEAVTFLTEDDVTFDFVAMDKADAAAGPREPFFDLDPEAGAFRAEEVILFSGGLDSFAGALEALASTSGNVLLVSHRSAQKVVPRQVALGNYLARRYPGRVKHLHVTARRVGSQSTETTQRSRSLLFAALGQTVARTFGARRVSFYENGTISHNLPISPQVIGTMATRTTHPFALHLLNRVMDLVIEAPAPIRNHFQWMTKTEIVERIARHGAAEQMSQAVSCTSIRDQTTLHTHCGACSQCLDRRFAVLAAGLARHDPEEAYATDVLLGARIGDVSKTMAVEWTRHALRLEAMSDRAYLSTFGLEVSRILRGHPDLETAVAVSQIRDLHRRHSTAVRRVLEGAIHAHARDLADGAIEETSLLRLHVGAVPGNALAADPRGSVPLLVPVPDGPETDLIPDCDGPLVAAFFFENGIPVIAVEGLGRLTRQPAKMGHELKPAFDRDRADGRLPDDHRFVPLFPEGMSKEAVRAAVRRCRRELAGFYTDLHGIEPDGPLLIQSRQAHGYRLDPHLRLTRRDSLS